MKNWITFADEQLLKLAQKISDKFQDLVGITSIHIAKIFLGGCCVCGFIAITSTILSPKPDMFFGLVGVQAIALSTGLWIIANLTRDISTSNAVFKNPLELKLTAYRKGTIGYALLGLIILGTEFLDHPVSWNIIAATACALNGFSFCCMSYFLSCTPKPPSKSKLKKLASDIRDSLAPKSTLTPQMG